MNPGCSLGEIMPSFARLSPLLAFGKPPLSLRTLAQESRPDKTANHQQDPLLGRIESRPDRSETGHGVNVCLMYQARADWQDGLNGRM